MRCLSCESGASYFTRSLKCGCCFFIARARCCVFFFVVLVKFYILRIHTCMYAFLALFLSLFFGASVQTHTRAFSRSIFLLPAVAAAANAVAVFLRGRTRSFPACGLSRASTPRRGPWRRSYGSGCGGSCSGWRQLWASSQAREKHDATIN